MTDFNERLQKAIHRGLVKGVEESEREKKEEREAISKQTRKRLSKEIIDCGYGDARYLDGSRVPDAVFDRGGNTLSKQLPKVPYN